MVAMQAESSVDEPDHSLLAYQSNWNGWQQWSERAQNQLAHAVVTEEALASLPPGMNAFRLLLVRLFPELGGSESQARKSIRQDCVLLDGVPVQWDTQLPSPGQILALRSRPWFGAQARVTAPMRLYRRVNEQHVTDEDRIRVLRATQDIDGLGIHFVYKPAGIESQPWEKTQFTRDLLTLEEFLPCVLPCPFVSTGSDSHVDVESEAMDLPQSGICLTYPKVAHRLDLRVCGVVAAATTRPALQHLKECFERRTAHKVYRAILAGDLSTHPRYDKNTDLRFAVEEPVGGRPARTEILILDIVPSLPYGAITTVNLYPCTGRQHQLREHMAGLGFPIIGDREHWHLAEASWHDRKGEPLPSIVPKSGPLYLQALSLELPVPGNEDKLIGASVPEVPRFAALRRKQRSQWESQGHGMISYDEARKHRHDASLGKLACDQPDHSVEAGMVP